ncbi:MAG: pilus assembly FimT family protein [Rubripirellula sp.]
MKTKCRRNGFTLTELMVASLLLVSLMTIVAPLTIRSTQLWRDTRHQQLALDELSNQIEYLSTLSDADREQGIAALEPSPEFLTALPTAELHGRTETDKDGQKLVLEMKWNRRPGQPRTVSLIEWLSPDPTAPSASEQIE